MSCSLPCRALGQVPKCVMLLRAMTPLWNSLYRSHCPHEKRGITEHSHVPRAPGLCQLGSEIRAPSSQSLAPAPGLRLWWTVESRRTFGVTWLPSHEHPNPAPLESAIPCQDTHRWRGVGRPRVERSQSWQSWHGKEGRSGDGGWVGPKAADAQRQGVGGWGSLPGLPLLAMCPQACHIPLCATVCPSIKEGTGEKDFGRISASYTCASLIHLPSAHPAPASPPAREGSCLCLPCQPPASRTTHPDPHTNDKDEVDNQDPDVVGVQADSGA